MMSKLPVAEVKMSFFMFFMCARVMMSKLPIVEVPDVADDSIVLHVLHVRQGDDLEVASCRSEDVDFPHNILHANHLKALHARLQRADGVDLSDQDTGASSPQGVSTSLAHIAIAAHQCPLAADHNICGT